MPMDTPTYHELAMHWKTMRSSHDIRVREVACVGAPRTLVCVDAGDHALPVVTLAAGVHGDEPAGPLALLELIERNLLDARFAYRIWACTNPTGFDAKTRTSAEGVDINRTFGRGGQSPEARAIVTANRDYKFALAIDLHEDHEASGFHCYEYGEAGLGEMVLASLRERGIPCDARGVQRPSPEAKAEELGGLSLALFLQRNAAQRVMVFETAASCALAERVATHVAAVQSAIAQTTVK